MENENFRKVKDDVRGPMHKKAMRMIKKGVKKKEVALIYGAHVNTITNWVKKYRNQGSK